MLEYAVTLGKKKTAKDSPRDRLVTPQARAKLIEVMRSPRMRKLASDRFRKQVAADPLWQEKAAEARRRPEVVAKRLESFRKWREEHPEEMADLARRHAEYMKRPECKARTARIWTDMKARDPEHYKEALARVRAASRAAVRRPVILTDGENFELRFACVWHAATWAKKVWGYKGLHASAENAIVRVCRGKQKSFDGLICRYAAR